MNKKVFIYTISLTAVIVTVFSACKTNRLPGTSMKKNTTEVIAHRGAFKKNNLPENSIASLREAIRLGCAGSEFDVRMTADDSMVINHDPAYHKLEIEKSTYTQLLAFTLSNGEKIPTLREYLLAGKKDNPGTILVVEIKPSAMGKERAQFITDAVVALVEKLGLRRNVVYISFDYEMVKRIHAIDPKAHTQYLNGDKSPLELKNDGITGLDYHYSVFEKNPDWIPMAHKEGIVLNAWTVNDAVNMDKLINAGFAYITTNEPEMLFERVKQLKP